MAPFAQGQPSNTGSVWDQMLFDGSQTGGTMPLAGSFADPLAAIFSTPLPEGLSKDDAAFLRYGQLQRFSAAETAKQNKEMMQYFLNYQERAAQKANEMGLRNVAIGSVVDAIKNIPIALGQGQRYTPERIAIAGRAMEIQPRGGTRPNYYGFVR